MSDVSTICNTIGRRRLAALLGVRPTAVSNAVAEQVFPAKWYSVVRVECEARGIECPEALFSFVAPVLDHDGDTGAAA